MNTELEKISIGVIGSGSWGTALANLLATKGYPLELWAFEPEVKKDIETDNENKLFLSGIKLSNNITPSNDLKKVASNKDILLIVVPSHCMREVSTQIAGYINPETIIITASKGIENKTHLTMHGILEETIPEINPEKLAVLSGPSFAKEVALRLPTVVAVASKDKKVSKYIQNIFATPEFRVYINDDPMGVEIGGAIKNVIAIAAGICDGMKLGYNARAAVITRGLTEMKRLGGKMGSDPHTFAGLSGVGDLLLTCTGDLSRNYTVGKKLGGGQTIDEILSETRTVAEGVKTTRSVFNLSKKLGVELPICNEVYNIIYEKSSPEDTVGRLMTRDLKHELD